MNWQRSSNLKHLKKSEISWEITLSEADQSHRCTECAEKQQWAGRTCIRGGYSLQQFSLAILRAVWTIGQQRTTAEGRKSTETEAEHIPNVGGGYPQGTVSVIEPRKNFSLLHQLIYYQRRVIWFHTRILFGRRTPSYIHTLTPTVPFYIKMDGCACDLCSEPPTQHSVSQS